MLRAYEKSTPVYKQPGDWHLPYSAEKLGDDMDIATKLKICTARAARTSYENFEGEIDIIKDIELHDRLSTSGHWSPFEHCAKALHLPERSGNFKGWYQYRKAFGDVENRTEFDAKQLLASVGQ